MNPLISLNFALTLILVSCGSLVSYGFFDLYNFGQIFTTRNPLFYLISFGSLILTLIFIFKPVKLRGLAKTSEKVFDELRGLCEKFLDSSLISLGCKLVRFLSFTIIQIIVLALVFRWVLSHSERIWAFFKPRSLFRDFMSLRTEKGNLERQLEANTTEKVKLKRQLENKTDLLDRLNGKYTKLEQKETRLKEESTNLKREKAALVIQKTELTRENERLRTENQRRLRTENQRVQVLQAENEQLRDLQYRVTLITSQFETVMRGSTDPQASNLTDRGDYFNRRVYRFQPEPVTSDFRGATHRIPVQPPSQSRPSSG